MIEVELPRLLPLQNRVASNPARYRVVDCGRRWGKTRMSVLLGLNELIAHDGAVMWVAPSYSKTEIGWRLAERIARQLPFLTIRRGDGRIETPGGGWTQFYSADSAGGLRGEGASLVIVDEAAHIPKLESIWHQEIRPSLSDRQGRAVFISTPNGYNFFYDLFKMPERDGDWRSWQYPTSTNPRIATSEIEKARSELPALVFRQEYGAEFVQLEGAMFRREYFSVVENIPALTNTVRFWDLAASIKTQADYSAGVKIGLDADGNAYILDVVHGRWEYPALLRVIKQTAMMDECVQFVETAGTQRGILDIILAEPTLAGIPFRGSQPKGDKITRANAWLARAEQGKIKLLRGEWNSGWLDEVCAFPAVEHDDQVDATSGAFSAVSFTDGIFW